MDTTKTKMYLDKQNIRRLNLTKVGEYTYIPALDNNGRIITYDTLVTENERSLKMNEMKEKRNGIKLKEDELIDLETSDDDGFISDTSKDK